MCSKHVEAYNKLTIKQEFVHLSWLITKDIPNVFCDGHLEIINEDLVVVL